MEINIIKPQDYEVSNWSGGKTTQLFIYPETGNYQNRDFIFRISSATVEAEFSDFTVLPSTNRIIMVLKGGLRLLHQGTESILSQYETLSFDGAKPTQSYGKATDFNLMMKGCTGSMQAIEIAAETEIKCEESHTFIYLDQGSASAFIDGKEFAIQENSTLHCSMEGNIKLKPTAPKTHAIITKVKLQA